MKDADKAPSPKRFCRKLGIRNAAMNASAESERPKYCAKNRWRIKPVSRLQRMPSATSAEERSTAGMILEPLSFYASPLKRRDAEIFKRDLCVPVSLR